MFWTYLKRKDNYIMNNSKDNTQNPTTDMVARGGEKRNA